MARLNNNDKKVRIAIIEETASDVRNLTGEEKEAIILRFKNELGMKSYSDKLLEGFIDKHMTEDEQTVSNSVNEDIVVERSAEARLAIIDLMDGEKVQAPTFRISTQMRELLDRLVTENRLDLKKSTITNVMKQLLAEKLYDEDYFDDLKN